MNLHSTMENKSDRQEAFKKFASWVEASEKKLNSACHCCPQTKSQANGTSCQNAENGCIREPTIVEEDSTTTLPTLANGQQRTHSWKNVINYHQNLQTEVEEYGKQLNCELKQHLSEDKSSTEKDWSESKDLEERWHKLWLKSLEQLVVVERTRRCPKHNSTIIGKPAPTTGDKSIARPQRRRPVSYPNNNADLLQWDYQHTLSLTGCHKEDGSQIDLDSVDEQATKNLTEFGENYELWFPKNDVISDVPIYNPPPSVEPDEKPEFAKAIVTSNLQTHEDVNPNLLMLTTPSSMLSVDVNRYPQKKCKFRMFTFPVLLAMILLIISAVYHEPHILHRTYYHKYPPV